MIINIKVIPNSSKDEVISKDEKIVIRSTAQPENNKANESVVKILSKHFKIQKTKIRIIKGHKSRNKTIEFSTCPESLQDNNQ